MGYFPAFPQFDLKSKKPENRYCFFRFSTQVKSSQGFIKNHRKNDNRPIQIFSREEGIRTLDTLLAYTHFPGVRLRPLGHLSVKLNLFKITEGQITKKTLKPKIF